MLESSVDEDFQEVVLHLKSLVEPCNPVEEKVRCYLPILFCSLPCLYFYRT